MRLLCLSQVLLLRILEDTGFYLHVLQSLGTVHLGYIPAVSRR